jgi:hypothetical protein
VNKKIPGMQAPRTTPPFLSCSHFKFQFSLFNAILLNTLYDITEILLQVELDTTILNQYIEMTKTEVGSTLMFLGMYRKHWFISFLFEKNKRYKLCLLEKFEEDAKWVIRSRISIDLIFGV